MSKRGRKVKALLAALCTGPILLQVGTCTDQDVKVELSNGVRTALNGMIGIVTADFANELFDVDD